MTRIRPRSKQGCTYFPNAADDFKRVSTSWSGGGGGGGCSFVLDFRTRDLFFPAGVVALEPASTLKRYTHTQKNTVSCQ